jgi:cytochrome P450
LTFPLPGFAGLSLLGFPEDDYGLIKEWSSGRVLLTYGHLPADRQIEIAKNVGAFWRYVEDHVASRDAERADDFTSDILGYRDQHPDAITTDDIVNIVYSMALAGHDSTTNAMGNALRHLLSHRDQWQRLIDDPSLIPNAVEELLRFDGPVLGHRRTAAVDTEIGGVPVPAGSKLVLLFASAAHDGEHFVDPQTLDVGRENADEHLAFGKGVHFCLGAPLARLELRIVLELLTDRTPAMTLVDGQPMPYQANALFRSVEQLLVRPRG